VSSFEPLKGRSSYRELLGFVKVCFLRFFSNSDRQGNVEVPD